MQRRPGKNNNKNRYPKVELHVWTGNELLKESERKSQRRTSSAQVCLILFKFMDGFGMSMHVNAVSVIVSWFHFSFPIFQV